MVDQEAAMMIAGGRQSRVLIGVFLLVGVILSLILGVALKAHDYRPDQTAGGPG